jgi:Helix-turn-helix domain
MSVPQVVSTGQARGRADARTSGKSARARKAISYQFDPHPKLATDMTIRKQLSLRANHVLTVMMRRCGNVPDSCWTTVPRLAKDSGRSKPTVHRALRELYDCGVVRHERVARPDPMEPENMTGWRFFFDFSGHAATVPFDADALSDTRQSRYHKREHRAITDDTQFKTELSSSLTVGDQINDRQGFSSSSLASPEGEKTEAPLREEDPPELTILIQRVDALFDPGSNAARVKGMVADIGLETFATFVDQAEARPNQFKGIGPVKKWAWFVKAVAGWKSEGRPPRKSKAKPAPTPVVHHKARFDLRHPSQIAAQSKPAEPEIDEYRAHLEKRAATAPTQEARHDRRCPSEIPDDPEPVEDIPAVVAKPMPSKAEKLIDDAESCKLWRIETQADGSFWLADVPCDEKLEKRRPLMESKRSWLTDQFGEHADEIRAIIQARQAAATAELTH